MAETHLLELELLGHQPAEKHAGQQRANEQQDIGSQEVEGVKYRLALESRDEVERIVI